MKPSAILNPAPISRGSLMQTAATYRLSLAGAIAGSVVLGTTPLLSDTWDGEADSDWNNATNWTNNALPAGEWAEVNTTGPNVATILADSAFTPSDIVVGNATGGRLDHTAGIAQTGGGNWMTVGFNGGGLGTYNLADTAGTGGTLTGFGTGSGTMNVNSQLRVGRDGGVGTVNVNTSGQLNVATELRVGVGGGTGTLNLDSGVVVTNEWTAFGAGGSSGTLNVAGGEFRKEGANHLIIGDGGLGRMNLSGGSVSANNEFWVGQAASGNGRADISGGTLTTNGWAVVGREGGGGEVNMTGGTWDHLATGQHLVIGASGTGTMNLSGGLVNVAAAAMEVGEGGTATLNVFNAGELRAQDVRVGMNPGSTGTLNLNGGIVQTGSISGRERGGTAGDGNSIVRFNGTQIIATRDEGAFITSIDTAEIQTGGLRVDSNGFTLASDQVFTGAGNIIKSGAGSLALDGDSGFVGNVAVSAGTLYVNGTLGGTVSTTVDAAATIGGTGSLAGLVAVDGTVAPGLSVGTLSADNMSISLGGTYLAEIDANGVNDQLDISGSLTIDGMIAVLLNYSPAGGDSFDLADFASFSGSPVFDFSSAPLDAGLSWDTSSFAGDGVIRVVPEPGSALLALLGLSGLALRRRRAAV